MKVVQKVMKKAGKGTVWIIKKVGSGVSKVAKKFKWRK